jgi:hypothetical protein
MIIFGFLIILNIQQQSIRAKILAASIQRRSEGQLARMLILQVSVHLILILPFGVTYSMNAFDPSTRTSNILAVRYILVMWQQCDYFLSFFSLHSLRKSLSKRIFSINQMASYTTHSIVYLSTKKNVKNEFPRVITKAFDFNRKK